MSDACLGTALAPGMAWQVSDKPQGRKPRVVRQFGAAKTVYGYLALAQLLVRVLGTDL